jgi:hypothetical protein
MTTWSPLDQARHILEAAEDDSHDSSIQAAATLALAEEARTANLLTLAGLMSQCHITGSATALLDLARNRLDVPASVVR